MSYEERTFDDCVIDAIKIGRKHMKYVPEGDTEPTNQEWNLALLLFNLGVTNGDIHLNTYLGSLK